MSLGHGLGLRVGASSLGVATCWADSTRPLSPRQGLPLFSPFMAPSPACSPDKARTLSLYLAEKTRAQRGAVTCPGLRGASGRRDGSSGLLLPATLRPLFSTLCRTCSGPPASTPASSCPTSLFMVFLGHCSFLWLSGMARFRMAGTREVTHGQQGTLAAALHPRSLHFPCLQNGKSRTASLGRGRITTRVAGSQGRRGRGKQPCGRSPSQAGLLWAQAGMEPAPLSCCQHPLGRGHCVPLYG